MVNPLDKEFKMFLKHKGIELDSSTFKLSFLPPQSFSEYREIEVNNARAAVFGQLAEVQYISRRFALKKYLGLTDEEIVENEAKWLEENPEGGEGLTAPGQPNMAAGDLTGLGVTRPSEEDFGQVEQLGQEGQAAPGAEATGQASPLGGAPTVGNTPPAPGATQ